MYIVNYFINYIHIFIPSLSLSLYISLSLSLSHTHTHTHIYIYEVLAIHVMILKPINTVAFSFSVTFKVDVLNIYTTTT